MTEMTAILKETRQSFIAAREELAAYESASVQTASVLESMGANPSASEILMAGSILGVDTGFAIEALCAFESTQDNTVLAMACEGILESIGDTLKGAVNRITGAFLKPLNMLMKVGAGLDKLASTAVNIPFEAITGKRFDDKLAARMVACIVAAGAIGVTVYSGMPQMAVNIAKSLRAGEGTGLFSPAVEQTLSKIAQFKWPFGNFTAVKSFSAGKISIKYKSFADKVGILRAEGGAGVFSKEAFTALCNFAKEAGAEILKITKSALIDIPKQLAKAALEVGKSASMLVGSGTAIKVAPTATIRHAVEGTKWFERALFGAGAATLAILTGFVGRVFITGAHALTSAIHSVTGSKAKA